MAQLPLDQAIPRFKANEDNVNTFVNGNTTQVYVTSNNVNVPSILNFLTTQANNINAYVVSYTANVYASVISAQTSAVAASVAAANSAIQAANSAVQAANSANIAVQAMNETLAVAVNPSDFATALQGAKADTAVQHNEIGTIAAQNANNVAVVGGNISNVVGTNNYFTAFGANTIAANVINVNTGVILTFGANTGSITNATLGTMNFTTGNGSIINVVVAAANTFIGNNANIANVNANNIVGNNANIANVNANNIVGNNATILNMNANVINANTANIVTINTHKLTVSNTSAIVQMVETDAAVNTTIWEHGIYSNVYYFSIRSDDNLTSNNIFYVSRTGMAVGPLTFPRTVSFAGNTTFSSNVAITANTTANNLTITGNTVANVLNVNTLTVISSFASSNGGLISGNTFNISSIASFTGVTSFTANVSITGTSNLSIAVANFKMSGGNTINKWLSTDGAGNLSWAQPAIADLSDGTSTVNTLNGNIIALAIALG